MKESIYTSDYLIGVSELGTNVREITLLGLLNEAGVLNGISQQEINNINNFYRQSFYFLLILLK